VVGLKVAALVELMVAGLNAAELVIFMFVVLKMAA
jgi:hypothetical protein